MFRIIKEESLKIGIAGCKLIVFFLLLLFLYGCGFDDHIDAQGGDFSSEEQPLRVYFLDVKEGDATVIKTPDNSVIMIDGGSDNMGKEVILPFLSSSHIEYIDLLVATHPDADHIGGLDEILNSIFVDEVWINGETKNSYSYTQLKKSLTEAQKEGTEIKIADCGEHYNFGDIAIDILNCNRNMEGTNNDSLVLKVSNGKISILLAADVESEGQRWMVNKFKNSLKAEILKVPHHGSANFALSFANAVSPLYAVFSCGADNPYGHPSLKALSAYKNMGAKICRTDLSGMIYGEIFKNLYSVNCN
jgi:beta-lactamase superfamily II metal-dependent hydrolase